MLKHAAMQHNRLLLLRAASPHLPCSKEELKQLFTLNTGKWGSAAGACMRFRLSVLQPCCSVCNPASFKCICICLFTSCSN